MKIDQPETIRREDYSPCDYSVETVELLFNLQEDATQVVSTLRIVRKRKADSSSVPMRLDGKNLRLLSIRIDGEPLDKSGYTLSNDGLTLLTPPANFTLQTEVEICPKANTSLEGLYVSRSIFCTQCEAEGFRHITYFPDRPDVMARFRVTLRAAKDTYPVLLSNGNLVKIRDLPNGKNEAVWEDPFPKPCYLFALVAGNLDYIESKFTTKTGRKVALRIFVEPGNQNKAGYAMDSLKRAMAWDERVFGLEYDLDVFNIVAVSDFNMGAMENKSLNIFNDKYILADPETATDRDYELIEAVVAHEYFHNWTGNRVTCRDWFQLSLKEGLTVFRDQQFSSEMRSGAVKRIEDADTLRTVQFREDAGPMAHPVRPDAYMEINNFYTVTVYEKGAEVIRMMHTLLGPEGFRRGMDLYFDRHDGSAVTCDDFVAAMEDATEVDLRQFRLWYSQAGTPIIEFEGLHDADARTFTLKTRQSTAPTPGQSTKQPLHIPFAVGLIDPERGSIATKLAGSTNTDKAETHVLNLKDEHNEFVFLDIGQSPTVSPNRNFSAPVIVQNTIAEDSLPLLMSTDTDAFNRWNAKQDFAARTILENVRNLQNGKSFRIDEIFISSIGAIIRDKTLDPAYKAYLMTLPSEVDLANRMDVEDPINIHKMSQYLRQEIAFSHKDTLTDLYEGSCIQSPYQPDAQGAGSRRLRNTILAYLGELENQTIVHRVFTQFREADNMTDRMAALAILNNMKVRERKEALDAFFARYRKNHIVIDKWFTIQATTRLPQALDHVKFLLEHPLFNLKNPNKVHSLIGAFANANPFNFHAKDGSGYTFLADQIIALDELNPQTAARLTAPLQRWQRFDSIRQQLMKTELERISATIGLSKNVREIVTKSLPDQA